MSAVVPSEEWRLRASRRCILRFYTPNHASQRMTVARSSPPGNPAVQSRAFPASRTHTVHFSTTLRDLGHCVWAREDENLALELTD